MQTQTVNLMNFSLHNPFLILRNLHSDAIITNLHIFLSVFHLSQKILNECDPFARAFPRYGYVTFSTQHANVSQMSVEYSH